MYASLIDVEKVIGKPIMNQPTIFTGKGRIYIGNNVHFGYFPSPGFYDGSLHIEARNINAFIKIGANTYINNNSVLVADKTSITIGNNVLMGTNVEITDSDFHNVNPASRNSSDYECSAVEVGNNVFIGSNVKILKGVRIGENSVIGNGAIVVSNIPANVIAVGVPAKVVRQI